MTRVLLAPDKFKGSLTAAEVARHLATGIRTRRPDVDIVTVPVADGGDGLLDAVLSAGFDRVAVDAVDALGRPVRTSYARRGSDAIVELAAICGLAQLAGARAPMTATSRGVGQVLAAALDDGCTHVVIGIGGSASTDGGAGLVQALGARVLGADGYDIGDGGGPLRGVATLDLSALRRRLRDVRDVRLEVAVDVDNPLTGPHGAAAVYGPQKGASAEQVRELDAALTRWADVVADAVGTDHRGDRGAGAAGGVGFAAVAALDARLRPGVELVLELVGFTEQLAGACLVVTGEGSIDAQTLNGKTPVGVATAAQKAGVPVVAVAGRCLLDEAQTKEAGFDAVYTLLAEASSEREAFTHPDTLLHRIGARIADRLDDFA
ncbi:MAG TPA: glycerate kinase [Jatrophihabitans sp.]|nr:glycerate kinase [Jatrophihabitans sp.]